MAKAAATLVLSGTQAGLEVGLDAYSWKIGPKFGGLREIKPGLHLLVMATQVGNGAVRQGVWMKLGSDEIVMKEWIAKEECIAHGGGSAPLNAESAAALRLAVNANPTSLGLGQYPDGHELRWHRLSRHISVSTLVRCGLQLDVSFWCEEEEEAMDLDDIEAEDTFDGEISGRPSPAWTATTATAKTAKDASALTRVHMDGSERMLSLVRTAFGDAKEELLGELELAFVVFSAMGSLSALRQWRTLLALACSSDALMGEETWTDFFDNLVETLVAQLELAPPDFFRDPISSAEDTLRPALANLFEGFQDRTHALFEFVRTRFGLFSEAADLQDARARRLFDAARSPEDAPVIVSLESGQAPDNFDSRVSLINLGFPEIAQAMDPVKEDAVMAAMRLLDQGPPQAADEARRYLESIVAYNQGDIAIQSRAPETALSPSLRR